MFNRGLEMKLISQATLIETILVKATVSKTFGSQSKGFNCK